MHRACSNPEPARVSCSPAGHPPQGRGAGCILGSSSWSLPLSMSTPLFPPTLPTQASICPGHRKVLLHGLGSPVTLPPPQERGFGAGVGSPEPGAGGEGDKQARGLIAVIITIIMAFIWLPNESDHRQREKLSIAGALMNFFANCNQARPSQLAD